MAPLIIGRPDQKGSTGRNNRMFVEGVHDADHLRKDIAAKKALAVIPNNPSRGSNIHSTSISAHFAKTGQRFR